MLLVALCYVRSFLFLVVRPGATSSFLLLVARPGATCSFLLEDKSIFEIFLPSRWSDGVFCSLQPATDSDSMSSTRLGFAPTSTMSRSQRHRSRPWQRPPESTAARRQHGHVKPFQPMVKTLFKTARSHQACFECRFPVCKLLVPCRRKANCVQTHCVFTRQHDEHRRICVLCGFATVSLQCGCSVVHWKQQPNHDERQVGTRHQQPSSCTRAASLRHCGGDHGFLCGAFRWRLFLHDLGTKLPGRGFVRKPFRPERMVRSRGEVGPTCS